MQLCVMEKCPICGRVCPHTDYCDEVGRLEESDFFCLDCELSEVFAYGTTTFTIGSLTWTWGYHDAWKSVQPIAEEYHMLCRILRQELRP